MVIRFAVSVLLICAALSVGSAAPGPTPTFTRDVAPILYKNCAGCHRPGEIAPMSLLTYEQVRPWAKSIAARVSTGTMPPWHSVDAKGTFSNDRRLSDEDRLLLRLHVERGVTLATLAGMFGLANPQAAHRRVQRVLAQLRQMLEARCENRDACP